MQTLTKRQNELLQRLAHCWSAETPPVVSELAREMGLAGQSSVTPMLEALRNKGYIEIRGGVRGRQRVLSLTAKGKVQTQRPGLPLLGCITAGPLSEALQMADVFIDTLDLLLPYKTGDFLLKVSGDSMTGDGIFDGDRVLVRPDVRVVNGEIAAVHVGDDYCATLKHVHFRADSDIVELRASNPNYAVIEAKGDEVKIIGVFRGLVRGVWDDDK